MEKNFKVMNRYGMEHEFINIKDNMYHFKPLYNYSQIEIDKNDKTKLNVVDPDGGPYMTRGTKLNGNKIIKDMFIADDKQIYMIIE